ncbi:N-acetylmuramoyl-L-alanine amidase [Nostoc linckia z18]|uniref:N-acetylmuramoyl-L-alanine amidase n=2 Tax=Nostoc linckia TaxID=92942 RepID=A0A9Q5Z7K2_NOSLI|nr:N-acetylmuramoyl-L-alanine amidase [Nostoc linckia]PHK39259.1 N-acetylmuramoyl-L-alanine amidase [Nostoc linckia z15]PHK43343.1 N-acetylmuramoyl-L-alanine amidase [Nostoc linckia z16]PHJ56108.1 N-acetylmuramoyl-L-alanine amidase [Nostoc linckia z1]PHJ58681.1 N-acetylmuramoyl-L-alanine amidase [Nostoc linckia z3]PHJ59793.1 N-acetylmuramoyl-L-alanine amidase [Nostoc linckia z2]
MKLRWLLSSTIGTIFMLSSPAMAAKLESWRFDANQNKLEINTLGDVQPQAQLIFNPTRLVIDLPGTTFGRPQLTQQVGGTIRAIRIGQFDEQTTRIVVELTPGYTLDPKKVKFISTNGDRWTVQLPAPETENIPASNNSELEIASATPPRTPTPALSPRNIYNVVTNNTANSLARPTVVARVTQIESLRTTGDGFFVATSGPNPQIKVNRSSDRHLINIDIAGATLSPNLQQQDIPINRYGVSRIQFSQLQSSPSVIRMTLQVDKNGSDWRATTSTIGGFVVLPSRGIAQLPSNNTPLTVASASDSPATIESVELTNNGRQLLIRADQSLSATGGWDRTSGLFRITINNARLAPKVKGPTFNPNSPILRVRLQPQTDNTVTVLIQPAAGVQIGELNQVSDQLLALEFRPSGNIPPIVLPPLPSPNQGQLPNPTDRPTSQPQPRPPVHNGKLLVVIDPGHGGKDSGAPGLGGLLEKDVVLPIGRKVAAILEQNGVQTVLTRDADFFVELQGRVDIAERVNATLFVSIHANSVDNRPSVNGLEVYYYDSGYALAEVVRNTILQNISTIKDRGTRKARFYVLRKSSMPSILVETGYMTGYEDNPRLASPEYQNRMAEAIASGILKYLRQR